MLSIRYTDVLYDFYQVQGKLLVRVCLVSTENQREVTHTCRRPLDGHGLLICFTLKGQNNGE